jgi:nicotinamide-nucleotide amidase
MTDADRVKRIADLAGAQGVTLATAESLTCGTLAKELGAGPNAADWFRGAVVAYQEPVKFDVLGVREGPVVTAECAEQMARGVRRLLGADVAISATGVGGPEPSEGKPAGTVFVAVATPAGVTTRELSIDGDPDDVLTQTVSTGLALLEETLRGR